MLRFHISELRERNAHHAFEDVCFELAKRRIASNVVRATGPVSQGGDQGRDFETFRTRLEMGRFPRGSFLELVSAEPIAFTCTLQRDRLKEKIKGDVRAITNVGTSIRHVYAFLGEALAVSNRHDLIEEVRAQFGVRLEILDRHAIADLLCDYEVFWIAVEYLHVPAEMTPLLPVAADERPTWYSDKLASWLSRQQASTPAESWGDLVDLRRCLDFAIFNSTGRPDLEGWVDALNPLLSNADDRLRQMARYSICVARYRGGSDSQDADRLVVEFCEELGGTRDTGLMRDAAVLLTYLGTAILSGWSSLTPDFYLLLHRKVRDLAVEILQSSDTPGRQAQMLGVEASLCLIVDIAAAATRNDSQAVSDGRPCAPPARYLGRETFDLESREFPLVDPKGALHAMRRLLDVIDQAPLYPIESTADYFDLLAPLLVDLPGYAEVRNGLDQRVTDQAGREAVAKKCRARASSFLSADRPFDALRELHEAKIHYWNGETVEEGLKCLVLIAGVYQNLRLVWAAKLYSLAAAMIAGEIGNPELLHVVPRGLLYAAECDALGGALLTSAATASIGFRAQDQFVEDPWDAESHPYLANPVQILASAYAYVKESGNEYAARQLEEANRKSGVHEIVEAILNAQGASRAEDIETIAQEYSCVVPADIGIERILSWSAHGVSWTVRCRNDENSTITAEGFAAALQIVLAEIGSQDPVFMLHSADFFVEMEGDESATPEEIEPSGASATWRVSLPHYSYAPLVDQTNQREIALRHLTVVASALLDLSALPWEKLEALLNAAVGPDLLSKLVVGRPSFELFSYLERDHWARIYSMREEFVRRADGRVIGNSRIPATDGYGPGYERKRALEQVDSRYRRVSELFAGTVGRVIEDPRTRGVLEELREDGWLDWHLLTAIANIRFNHRLSILNVNGPLPIEGQRIVDDERVGQLVRVPEEEGEAELPLELVDLESMQLALEMSAYMTLEGWGLTVNRNQIPTESALDLLRAIYGYANDDVAHEPLF